MLGIESFLEKFKHIVPTDSVVREQCIIVVQTICGVTLKKENIQVRSSIINISCRPAMKNEIILHKQEILNMLNDTLSESTIINIL